MTRPRYWRVWGLAECGVASDEFGAAVACAEFPDGWLVIVSNRGGLDLEDALPAASARGLALGCEVEEHVMFSRLRAFRGGAPAWAVTHDPDIDVDGVVTEGEPPPAVQAIRGALVAEWGEEEEGVDYRFDLPIRLGQQLCGYAHDASHPVVWTILERPGRRGELEPAPRLPQAFSSELLPPLEASGWTRAAQDPQFGGGAWDVTRVVEGRRQLPAFSWLEHGAGLRFETSFLVQDGERWTDPVLLAGEIRVVRSDGRPGGPSLWRRIVARFRAGPVEPAAPPDRLAELVVRVREDLAAVEAFLATGDHDARIYVRRGSADVLRPAAA